LRALARGMELFVRPVGICGVKEMTTIITTTCRRAHYG